MCRIGKGHNAAEVRPAQGLSTALPMRFSFMTTGLRSLSITKTALKQSISPSSKNRAWVRILMHSLHQKETTISERRSSFFGSLHFSLFRSSLFSQIVVSGEWIRENGEEKRWLCRAKQIYKKPVDNSRQVFSDCQKSPQDAKAHLREKVSEKL